MATRSPIDAARPIHWILDWDGTITRRDTLDALVNIAASAKPDSPVLEEWKRVSEVYMSDYTAALEKFAPGGILPTTIEKEKELMRVMKSVEQASLDRVSSSAIFEGLTRRLLEEGAISVLGSKKVELRMGFAGFLACSQKRRSDELHLVSVNWSRHFIDSCLRAAATPVQKSLIYANELDGIECDTVSTGHISPGNDAETLIMSSGDKLEYMNRLRKQGRESQNGSVDDSTPIVYVGDSWTDIECLLDADLGICIRDEPMGSSQRKLVERLQDLGVRCPHLSDWIKADQQNVAWAKDFTEIKAWIEAQ